MAMGTYSLVHWCATSGGHEALVIMHRRAYQRQCVGRLSMVQRACPKVCTALALGQQSRTPEVPQA